MERTIDWNDTLSFQSSMTNSSPALHGAVVEASLTWMEIFVGLGSIVKDTENINKIHKQFDHMLFGYSEVFSVPDSIFQEMITTMVDSEMMEWIDSENVELSDTGVDYLKKNWFIDRSVFTRARAECETLASRNAKGIYE